MRSLVRTTLTYSCTKKIKLAYDLPFTIQEEALNRLPEIELRINRFSQVARAAKDHFTLSNHLSLTASGVIGDTVLNVTFWKDNLEEGITYIDQCIDLMAHPDATRAKNNYKDISTI